MIVTDLSVALGGARVVDGVTVTVGAGEWVALVGPNGAGKTTVLRAVAGLVPHTGSVLVGEGPTARLVAYAPQDPVVPPGMPVGEYVLLGRTPHLGYLARPGRADREVAAEVLDALDLGALADRTVATLSGGERRRAVLGRALAQRAPVLLLDEPTAALDVGHAQQVLDLVDALRRERGLTVLASLHDLTLAGLYADRVLLLVGGRSVAVGTPAEVLTAERLAEHYGARVEVTADAAGRVAVTPTR